jgi:dTDP-4-amino-4,6-dideoxygalactose transaminase
MLLISLGLLNWIAPFNRLGIARLENVTAFEQEVNDYVGATNAVALSSGTAAIHMALRQQVFKKDDVVICQSFTFSATANPIIYEGAIPVFIDSDESTWNIDLELLRKALHRLQRQSQSGDDCSFVRASLSDG